jgi:hypothetical protein
VVTSHNRGLARNILTVLDTRNGENELRRKQKYITPPLQLFQESQGFVSLLPASASWRFSKITLLGVGLDELMVELPEPARSRSRSAPCYTIEAIQYEASDTNHCSQFPLPSSGIGDIGG